MRTIKFLTLFFLLLPAEAFAQWEMNQRLPFEASTTWDNVETRHAASLQSDNDFLSQSDLFYRDNLFSFGEFSSFNPSGDFLTNVFGSSYLGTGLSTDDGHRNHLAISSIPLGNGVWFLLIISMLYLSILITKKQLFKMKTMIYPSKSPLKGRLWLTHNVENSQTLKAPFRGLGGKLFLFFLLFCGNTYAQLPLKAVPDNAFMLPSSGSVNLNVLRNDELGACNSTSVAIQLFDNTGALQTSLITGAGGTAVVSADGVGNKIIIYTPISASFVGQDSLRYKIECNGKFSPDSVLVLINVMDQPGNILDNVCAVSPIPTVWAMKEVQNLGEVCIYTPALVGDMDGDGKPEIVTGYMENQSIPNPITDLSHPVQRISVFRGTDRSRINFITTQPYTSYMPGVIAIGKTKIQNTSGIEVDSAIIVVAEADEYLRAYDMNGTLIWTSSAQWTFSHLSTSINYCHTSVNFTDFNNDGYAEIYTSNQIFNAATGVLLCQGSGNIGLDYNLNVNKTNEISLVVSSVADVYGDSRLELIAGNQIYQVATDLTSMTVIQEWTPDSLKCIDNPSETFVLDGWTQVADVDKDGHLDIIVENHTSAQNSFIYIWSPFKGEMLAQKLLPDQCDRLCIPFIGDIDGDGNVEILFITGDSGVASTYYIHAYKYEDGNPLLQLFWKLSHSDGSLNTGLTLFDFNQDGVSEIVYRDENVLRIINGSGIGVNYLGNPCKIDPTTKILTNYELVAPIACMSGTGFEYATIADIDGDSEAEILISGPSSGSVPVNGPLRIFKSNGSPWAYARPVWNQYMYNPVYITDSLTVPAYPLNPATKFVTKDGSFHQPYNNFLQQATLLNDEGKQLRFGPDLAFDKTVGTSISGEGVDYTQSGNDYNVTVYVENQGDAVFPTNVLMPLYISAYIWDTSIPAYVRKFSGTFISPDSIPMGATRSFTFTIPNGYALTGGSEGLIQLRLNELDNLFPMTALQEECVYWNNFFPSGNYGAPDQIACLGETTRINFFPQNSSYSYVWFEDDGTGNKILLNSGTPSDYIDIIKTVAPIDSFFVDVYDNANPDTPVESKYRIDVYLAPDSLIWTGNSHNNDWHDYNNWLDPNDANPTNPQYPQSKIPRPCTHVLIPDGLDYYANLSEDNTTRTIYRDASCDHIHFEFGGEVAQTDRLTYTKAWIQYNFGFYNTEGNDTIAEGFTKGAGAKQPSAMERDQWYALSAPLNKIVTGDFSLGGKPHTWQKRFVRSNVSGTFTGAFDWPDDTIFPNNEAELNEDLGFAIALLVADNNPGYNGEDWSKGYQTGLDTLKGIITLPYFEGPYDESDFDDIVPHTHPHRVHKYDTGSKTSFFKEYWYYVPDVPLTDHPQGSIQRENEAYRFIFDGKMEQIPGGTLAGKNAFKITVPTGKEIMLGNPFMSSFKFNNFYLANSAAINNYFRLYNGTFNTYEYNVGSASITDTIAVLQAFFITTTGAPGSTVDLYFPFETTSITRETNKDHQDYFKSPKADNDVVYVTATSNANKNKATSATLALNQDGQNVYQLFYEASNNIPQVYFIDENGQKNAVQYSTDNENQATTTIPLGLRSGFGNRVTLTFDINAEVEALTLLDKKTGQTQDLLQNNSYTFTQNDNTTPYIDRFEVSFKSPTAISEIKNESKIAIYQDNETVTVSSSEKINSVELFDMQGRKVKQADKIENNVYQMNLRRGVARNAPTGVYIVKAVLGNGETQTHKIIVK